MEAAIDAGEAKWEYLRREVPSREEVHVYDSQGPTPCEMVPAVHHHLAMHFMSEIGY
jgi:hypothetical protein